MFYHKLNDQFKRQSDEPAPFPRGAVQMGARMASQGGSTKLGVALALGAALFGGLLVTANVNRSAEEPQATAAATPPVQTSPAQAPPATVAAVQPTAPAPAPVMAKAPEVKSTAPLDMAATGAIGEEPVKKLHPDAKPKAKKKPAAHNP